MIILTNKVNTLCTVRNDKKKLNDSLNLSIRLVREISKQQQKEDEESQEQKAKQQQEQQIS